MPLLQPGSRSPQVQARLARLAAEAAGVGVVAATAVAEEAQATAEDAQAQAGTAATAAATAQGRADTLGVLNAIGDSYTIPSEGILSASDAGATTTIHIAAHVRRYPDTTFPDVAIAAADITGLPHGVTRGVCYDDLTLADTTPAFQALAVVADAQVGVAAGRHALGAVATPAAAGPPTTGGGYYPPGGTRLSGPIP